ncbi:MAG TPA: DUF167 domain-containing protein [Pirellulaceae bacterium]|nr:DUF167 domain-containing protein [Pirellulaceae bacterium]
MTIALADHPQGVVLPVKAQPGARQNGIRGEHDGMLKVSVTQVAEKGKANQSLVEVVAKGLGLARSQVELIGGELAPQKKFLIRGISREELNQRIAEVLGSRSR